MYLNILSTAAFRLTVAFKQLKAVFSLNTPLTAVFSLNNPLTAVHSLNNLLVFHLNSLLTVVFCLNNQGIDACI